MSGVQSFHRKPPDNSRNNDDGSFLTLLLLAPSAYPPTQTTTATNTINHEGSRVCKIQEGGRKGTRSRRQSRQAHAHGRDLDMWMEVHTSSLRRIPKPPIHACMLRYQHTCVKTATRRSSSSSSSRGITLIELPHGRPASP